MSNPKYHHLIPRTYLRAWCHSNDSVYVVDKGKRKLETKNINTNFGISQFHTITAGMMICEDNDLNQIFKYLDGYEIYLNNKKLSDFHEYNINYTDFDDWIIKKDSKPVSKKTKNILKSKIEQEKILEIENLWQIKFENKWRWLRDTIEYNVLRTKSTEINQFYKGLIMRFVVAFNWRGFYGNELFRKEYEWISDMINLDEIIIPYEERYKVYLETASVEMEHLLLLKNYREFLRDKGIMYKMAVNYVRLLGIMFYVAGGSNNFITSDNPSFIGKFEGQSVHIFPVSPRVIVCLGKNGKNEDKYLVKKVPDRLVSMINKQIYDNCVDRIIMFDSKDNIAKSIF
jgi:hypothetical protein